MHAVSTNQIADILHFDNKAAHPKARKSKKNYFDYNEEFKGTAK